MIRIQLKTQIGSCVLCARANWPITHHFCVGTSVSSINYSTVFLHVHVHVHVHIEVQLNTGS